jgi:hypothetical protein
MNSSKHFDSQIHELGHFANDCSNDDIKNEPMFFNCDLDFAWDNGGNITRSFISNLPYDWQDEGIVFDSRVHMLMPGWYPAIPGFHHDDVPRPDIPVVSTSSPLVNRTTTIRATFPSTSSVWLTQTSALPTSPLESARCRRSQTAS